MASWGDNGDAKAEKVDELMPEGHRQVLGPEEKGSGLSVGRFGVEMSMPLLRLATPNMKGMAGSWMTLSHESNK